MLIFGLRFDLFFRIVWRPGEQEAPALTAVLRPRRLAWPRTSPFHGGNTGSNPVGDANNPKELAEIGILPEGSEGSNKGKASLGLSHGSLRWQEHFHQFGLRGSFG